MPVRSQRIGQDERVPPIIFRPRNGMTVSEAVQLLRIDRIHCISALQERLYDRPAWNLNRDGHLVGLAIGHLE